MYVYVKVSVHGAYEMYMGEYVAIPSNKQLLTAQKPVYAYYAADTLITHMASFG